MRPLLGLGMSFGGCLMLIGLLSSCTLILLPFGIHLIWIGFLVMAVFWLARQMLT